MRPERETSSNSTPLEAEIRGEASRILSSPAFTSQDRLQKFLSYVVDRTVTGHADELKEMTIGFDVFERGGDYDSRIDPIVRIQARRLRDKLDEYYNSADSRPIVRISIPKGGYVPEFSYSAPIVKPADAAATTPEPPQEAPPLVVTKPAASPRDRRFLYFALGASATIAAAILLGFYSRTLSPPGVARIHPFVDGRGSYEHAAFSPDGRQLAFDWDGPENSNIDIYVQALDSDTPLRLTSSPSEESRPAWSPDGKQIAFLRSLPANRAAIVIIPALGGPERVVTELPARGAARLDWSPDGTSLITSRPSTPDSVTSGLIVISVANGSQRTLTSPQWGTPGDGEAAYSPDGSLIAFQRGKATAVEDLFTIPAQGGEPRQLTADATGISGLAWAPDSKSIVYAARRTGEAYGLWRQPLDKGAPIRLTATTRSGAWPSVARMGNRVAFSIQTDDENVWRLDLDGKRPPAPVLDSTSIDTNPSLSRDGEYLAFRSSRTGSSEIWVSKSDGTSAHRLTHYNGAQCGSPDWSPDGRSVAYDARLNGPPHVYVVSREGNSARRLTTDDANEVVPHWSRDGRSIYYASNASGAYEIWKKALDGGPAVQVTHNGGYSAQESFNGQILYFTKGPSVAGIWRQPLPAGPEELVAPELPGRMWGNWRVTTSGVYFLDFNFAEKPYSAKLYFYDFVTRRTRIAARTNGIAAAFNSGLAVSPDERTVYFVQVDHFGASIYLAEGLAW
jgi:Tol biopolymer transport system component